MSQLTLRRLKLVAGVLVGIAIVGVILFYLAATVPVGPRVAYFVVLEDVLDPKLTHRERMLMRDVAAGSLATDYVIYEGELYLKVQETQNTLLQVEVRMFEWSKERLDQLVKDHPELEVYTK